MGLMTATKIGFYRFQCHTVVFSKDVSNCNFFNIVKYALCLFLYDTMLQLVRQHFGIAGLQC